MSVINHTNGFSVAHELIYTLKVRDAMSRDVVTVVPDNSLREVQALLRERRISGTPVLDNGRLVGIVSLEDIISALDHGHIEERVGDWMTTNVVTIQDNMPLHRAVEFFRRPLVDPAHAGLGIPPRRISWSPMEELNRIAEECPQRSRSSNAGVRSPRARR